MILACRTRPCHFVAFSVLSSSPARSISTPAPTSTTSTALPPSQPTDKPQDKSQDSIFTAPESPWDHVFADIGPTPSMSPSLTGRKKAQSQGVIQRSSGVRHQRASITAREMRVFNDMFDLIFSAMAEKGGKARASSAGSGTAATPYVPGQTPGIGRASGAPLNDVFRTLRRQTSRVRWTTAIDEELDRKKETMELFDTDYDLLQWVTLELFGEHRSDEDTKGAMGGSVTVEEKGSSSFATGVASIDATTSSPSSPSSSSSSQPGHPINPSIYPHLIAHAMRLFRKTYSNPSLSLAIFNHAARVSIPSYVFGCTAPAYNELIEAKWEGWGDLEGVCNALEEMRANGVKIDGRTRIVVERVRRDVGEARPAELDEPGLGTGDNGATSEDTRDVNLLARRAWRELGEVEVMGLIQRIERLALRDRSRKSTSSPHEEMWKSTALQSAGDDGWSFDGWDKEKRAGDAKRRTRKTETTSQGNVGSRTLDDWTVLDTPEEDMVFR